MGKKFRQLSFLLLAAVFMMSMMLVSVSAAWDKIDGLCYNDKGQVVPGAITKGIDVSKWDETINWTQVKNAGIDFAFIRVGHGDEPRDPKFQYNMTNAIANDIPVGIYFYSMADSVERAIEDAKFCIQNVQGYKISYPIVYDIEDDVLRSGSKSLNTQMAIAFCEKIKSAGYYPMLYCDEAFYQEALYGSQLTSYDMWIARWASTYSDSVPRTIWQTGATTIPGVPVECDVNFGFVDYTKVITPRTSYDSGYDEPYGGWIQTSAGKYWYRRVDGSRPVNEWEKIDDTYYYFDSSGYRISGWLKWSGQWYYLDSDGKMVTGMFTLGSKTYYLSSSGAMVKGWKKVDGSWYYFGSGGAMVHGWLQIGTSWYYLQADGKMATGFTKVGERTYYLNAQGVMLTGWQKLDNVWYYFNKGGSMAVGWIKSGSYWYYLQSDGKMAKGWIDVEGRKYYLKSSGAMLKYWQKLDGIWYYFGSSGAMATKLWVKSGTKWYYLGADGKMAKDQWIGSYHVGSDGAWIR